MIYTVTLNPAVDYVITLDSLAQGKINRTKTEEIHFGGKGINVSVILSELGVESTALGFVAGFTGEAIEKSLTEKGIKTDFVHIKDGFSRINVKISGGEETEINGSGPEILPEDIEALFEKIEKIGLGDTLVLSGGVPRSLSKEIYKQILDRVKEKGVRIVVDAEGELLLKTLEYSPFLVKPNLLELGDLFGVSLEDEEDALVYAKKLRDMGAENVIVSMGEKGAVLLDDSGCIHFCPAAEGIVKSTVGAGDSLLAGFLAGVDMGDYDYALMLGCAAGSATAFGVGLADRNKIFEAMEKLK